MKITKHKGDEQPAEGTSGLKQGLGDGEQKFFTFYLKTPNEENETELYQTFEEAFKAAEDFGASEFYVSEIAYVNIRKFRASFEEVDVDA